MKTVKLFWIGLSKKNETPYIGVETEDSGFFVTKFIKVTQEKFDELEAAKGDEKSIDIEIPVGI